MWSGCSLQLSIRICLVIAVFVLLCFGGAAAQDDNVGTIALGMETESGLQINYAISGATITKVGEDDLDTVNGLSNERVLEGVLDSDQLRISGVATYKSFKDRSDSDLVVKVVDDSSQVVGKPYTDNTKGSGEMKFDLVVPVSKDKTYHFEIVETGYMNYNHKVKVSGTLHPAPQAEAAFPKTDTRSSKTFDPRSLKPRTGAYLTNIQGGALEGDVYVVRDGKQITAINGFQLRAEDVIIVPNDSEMCKLVWPGPEDPEKVYRETGIFDPGIEVFLKPGSAVRIDEAAKERTRYLSRPNKVFFDYLGKNANSQNGAFLIIFTNEAEEETLKVEGKYGNAVSEHTQFICIETNSSSILKVIEGKVRFISNVNSEDVRVNAGEMVTATSNGLSQPQTFDVKAEKASWGKYFPKTETPLSGFTNLEREIILASTWTVSERGPQGDYDGTWTRRPGTDTFDASWSGGSIIDVIDITSVEGDKITLHRHGNNGDYTGTISPDGTSVSGTASWYVPEETWTASTT